MSYYQCEPEIFRNGLFVKSMNRTQGSDADAFCRQQEKDTNNPYDWFIVADRIIIKKLNVENYKKKDMQLVRLLIDDLIAEGRSDLKDLSNVIGKHSPLNNTHIQTIRSSLEILEQFRNTFML